MEKDILDIFLNMSQHYFLAMLLKYCLLLSFTTCLAHSSDLAVHLWFLSPFISDFLYFHLSVPQLHLS